MKDVSEPRCPEALLSSARKLAKAVAQLKFAAPVDCVYNPLDYAWAAHAAYLRGFASAPKRVVFIGMNPGPFGMVQTGVPFGEVTAVRTWLRIEAAIGKPARQHARRPIAGFACHRCEISGLRLWGLFARRFGSAQEFFREHIVLNYCPLAFIEKSGRNRTPDKLPALERQKLFAFCDEHLRTCMGALRPEWLIAIGDFAFKRAQAVVTDATPKVGRILHPSPASPAANRNWEAAATRQLEELGVWPKSGP